MSIQERYADPSPLAGKKFAVATTEALDESGRPVGKRERRGFDTFKEAADAFNAITADEAHLVVLDRLNAKGFMLFNPLARRVGGHAEALGTYRGKSVFTA